MIEKTKTNTAEVTKTATQTTKKVRTKISEIKLEFGNNIAVSVSDIEKAVKEEALQKGLKGDIKIYLNINEMTAYYTVDGAGDESNSVKLEDK